MRESHFAAESAPRRRRTRLRGHDYSSSGPYFVTVCTYDAHRRLSTIFGEGVVLTTLGQAIRETWLSLPDRFPGLVLDEFVIMPDHFHALLAFASAQTLRASRVAGDRLASPSSAGSKSASQLGCSLPVVIGAFKSISTIRVNKLCNSPGQPLWQRTYHDHIIRNADDMKNAQRYIQENPFKWTTAKSKPRL